VQGEQTVEDNSKSKERPTAVTPQEARGTSALEALKALAEGFATTFRHLFRKPVTEEYPEYKRPLPERSRARIVLTRDPDGGERCVACYLCSGVCPVSCISMQAAEMPDGRRYAAWFRINFARCIYCGLCEEACPTAAIQLTPDYENIQRDILKLVFEKEDLLVDGCGKDKTYNFYRWAGVATAAGGKGAHEREAPPVRVRSNLP
jgi:NADH-quinone oxidoreductase subunit I